MNMGPCTKIAYENAQAARNDAARIAASERRFSKSNQYKTRRCYQCQFCGLWHLTSQSKAQAKQHKRRKKRG